jgi:T5orf172 domain
MIKVPGSIYFLRERDFLTGEVSPYVKIGLVRKDKPTEKRILEHQTGNPREIYDYQTIEATFVEDLETRLHYIFGAHWVTGEWFLLDELQLLEVIDVAQAYAQEQQQLAAVLDQADELATMVSSGLTLDASANANALWEELKEVRTRIAMEKATRSIAELKLRNLLGVHRGIRGIIDVQVSKSAATFNKAAFEESTYYAQFAAAYTKVQPGKFSGSFLLKNIPNLKTAHPLLDEELKALKLPKVSSADLTDVILERTAEMEALHLVMISQDAKLGPLEWKNFQLETHLKLEVGVADGIKDICTWKRLMKAESEEFDVQRFKEEQPDIAELFMHTAAPSVKHPFSKFRAYPHL